MDYKIEKMNGFTVIGFEKTVSEETAYRDCPAFWSEYQEKYMTPALRRGRRRENMSRPFSLIISGSLACASVMMIVHSVI